MPLIDRFDKIIGIDPGSSNGGIAVLSGSGMGVSRMPKTLAELKKVMKEQCEGYSPIAFIERVSMRPPDQDEPGKIFRIRRLEDNQAQLWAMLTFLDVPFVPVMPYSWQRYLNLYDKSLDDSAKKKKYQSAANSWYPREKGFSLWAADAVCLVQFGHRKMQYDPKWCLERIKPEQLVPELF